MNLILRSAALMVAVLLITLPASANQNGNSCWGQATAVYAQLGEMGAHSSQQAEPRLGLANLARLLYDAGEIPEPTLAALGAYVAGALGLQIDRCTNNPAAVAAAEQLIAIQAACWGQASQVFARMGLMGQHASQESTPRLGLRNLARALAELGVIPDGSMASLGAFVAAEEGLSIDACE
jgi:hypothetical protein